MSVSAVLFDLDNTLTDRKRSIDGFVQRFYDDYRRAMDANTSFDTVYRVIHEGDGGGYRPKALMYQDICDRLVWHHPPTHAELHDYWYRVSRQCMVPRDDALATLERLRADGYKLGLVTNGPTAGQNASVDALGIRPLFGSIIVSETVAVQKPDARIFEIALAELDVTPSDAVYVGDHPVNDIQGARNAGLKPVWYGGIHDWPADMPPPEVEIRALSDLFDYV